MFSHVIHTTNKAVLVPIFIHGKRKRKFNSDRILVTGNFVEKQKQQQQQQQKLGER